MVSQLGKARGPLPAMRVTHTADSNWGQKRHGTSRIDAGAQADCQEHHPVPGQDSGAEQRSIAMKLRRMDPDIQTLVGRIDRGTLDLQPSFQRGEIWDKKRQQRLIDTILRDWYIPAIHIVKTGERQEVLDGQQRLAAIRDFVNNDIRINGHTEPANEFIQGLDGLYFDDMPRSVQLAVLNYSVPVVVLTDFEPGEPNELFFRLNQAYNLTPPEKRNALHGPARDQVKDLVSELTELGLLDRAAIGFGNARLAYDDIVSRACVSAQLNTLRRHINNDVVEEIYRRPDGFSPASLKAVSDGAALLFEQISDSSHRIKFNKGTLQTWLLYAAWACASGASVPTSLLEDFEQDRTYVRLGNNVQSGHDVAQVLSLYDDRASYRVTDVSSVLIRDLSIHLYIALKYNSMKDERLGDLISALGNPEANGQALLLAYIETSSWGADFLSSNAS